MVCRSRRRHDRFLDRVFTCAPEDWVLGGGVALLARAHDARHSTDVDLNRTTGKLVAAVAELIAAAGTDLRDHVWFTAEFVAPLQPALVSTFLNPVLAGSPVLVGWSHHQLRWQRS